MFDNPRKELERLQEELLAAEAPEEEVDFSDTMEWDEDDREPLYRSYTDAESEDWEDTRELISEDVPEEDEPAPKHYTGLKFAIALELLALAALFWWWYLWIR